jgi:hypothetical protein
MTRYANNPEPNGDESKPIREAIRQLPRHPPPPGLRKRLLAIVTEEAQQVATPQTGGRVHQVRIVQTLHGNTRTIRRFEQTNAQTVPLSAPASQQRGAFLKHLSGSNNQTITYLTVR